MSEIHVPNSRYILPSFVERTSYGIKESNPYNKLFEERIIFLGVQIDDASANDVMAQLLTLESTDPDRDIIIYINSPGGSFTALTAIYDTMQFVKPEIQTVCLGQAASAAAVLLAAGTPGKRFALENSRIIIHQPATEGGYGQSATSRSRPTRSCGCARCSSRCCRDTPDAPRSRSARTSSATRSSPPRSGRVRPRRPGDLHPQGQPGEIGRQHHLTPEWPSRSTGVKCVNRGPRRRTSGCKVRRRRGPSPSWRPRRRGREVPGGTHR